MTAKIIVTLGGDVGAPEVDYTAVSPFFEAGEGESSQWSLETTFANGDDGQGEFVVDNDSGEIPRSDGTRNLAAKNPVRLTEDASGTDYTLVFGRILEKDVTRNEDYPIADASQYRVTVAAPGDLALMKLTEDWVRPVETDYQRLVALQAYMLNGSASTAPKVWNTVDVTVDATHLTPKTNTVSMPAHIYQAGTALDEIIEDIRTMAGKTWGIVPHHIDGVGSHKCLQFVVENDNTTNPCTIKISDDLADLDPDGLSGPPVIAPQWGAPRHEAGEEQTFGLVVRYGPDDKYVYVEGPHVTDDIAAYDRAVDTIYDDQSETAAQATARGLALIEYKRFERVTHTVILKVRADHVHLIAPGMSIDIKSAAAMSGAYLHTWQTRRIASVQYEPMAPEAGGDFAYYQVTLELDRRLRREPVPRSSIKPGPKPPSPGGDTICTYPNQVDTGFAIDGDVEAGNVGGQWYQSGFGNQADLAHSGTHGIHNQDLGTPPTWIGYTFENNGVTFKAGVRYVAALYVYVNSTTGGTLHFGVAATHDSTAVATWGDSASVSDPFGSFPNSWTLFCIEWTPTADATDVHFQYDGAGGYDIAWDDLVIYKDAEGEPGISIGGPGEGTVGDGNTYVPGGTVVEHGDLSGKGGIMHDDTQIEVDPTGLTNTDGVTVHEVIEDFDAAITAAAGAPPALDDLSDVTITTATAADRLRFTGTAWVNSALLWRPVMTFDGTNWLPVVDGDGNAVMTEA